MVKTGYIKIYPEKNVFFARKKCSHIPIKRAERKMMTNERAYISSYYIVE
jgi:hypothetical protein